MQLQERLMFFTFIYFSCSNFSNFKFSFFSLMHKCVGVFRFYNSRISIAINYLKTYEKSLLAPYKESCFWVEGNLQAQLEHFFNLIVLKTTTRSSTTVAIRMLINISEFNSINVFFLCLAENWNNFYLNFKIKGRIC